MGVADRSSPVQVRNDDGEYMVWRGHADTAELAA